MVAETTLDDDQVAELPKPAFVDGPIPEPVQPAPLPRVDEFGFPAPDGWKSASECTVSEIYERNKRATLAGRDLLKATEVTGVLS
jgi:hypothetical protein